MPRESEKEIVVILPFMSLCGPFFVKSNKFYRREKKSGEKNLQTMAHISCVHKGGEEETPKFCSTIEFLFLVVAVPTYLERKKFLS